MYSIFTYLQHSKPCQVLLLNLQPLTFKVNLTGLLDYSILQYSAEIPNVSNSLALSPPRNIISQEVAFVKVMQLYLMVSL